MSTPSHAEGYPPGRKAEERPSLRLGGMALGNGLFLHSERFWAAAIRDDDGQIKVASGAKRFPRAADEGGIPLLRGLARLADGLMVMWPLKRELPASILPIEERRIQRAVMVSVFSALSLRAGGGPSVRRELEVMGASLIPLFAALRGSELAAYHGAEHKSIGEFEAFLGRSTGAAGRYEQPAEARESSWEPSPGSTTPASPSGSTASASSSAEAPGPGVDAQALKGWAATQAGASSSAAKEHERCGSNVIGPVLVTSLASNLVVRSVWRRPTPAVALVSGLVSLGAALEVFRWMSRHPRDPVARVLAWPGRVLQESVTTKEPDEAQMEVARAALAELLRLEALSPRSRRPPVAPGIE